MASNKRKNKITFTRSPQKNQRFYISEGNTGWSHTLAASAGSSSEVEHLDLPGNVRYNYNIKIYNSYGTLSQEENKTLVTTPRTPSLAFQDIGNKLDLSTYNQISANLRARVEQGDGTELPIQLRTHNDNVPFSERQYNTQDGITHKNSVDFGFSQLYENEDNVLKCLAYSGFSSDYADLTVPVGYWVQPVKYHIYSGYPDRNTITYNTNSVNLGNYFLYDTQIYFDGTFHGSLYTISDFDDAKAHWSNIQSIGRNWVDKSIGSKEETWKIPGSYERVLDLWLPIGVIRDSGTSFGRTEGARLGFENAPTTFQHYRDFGSDTNGYKELIMWSSDPGARIGRNSSNNPDRVAIMGSGWKGIMRRGFYGGVPASPYLPSYWIGGANEIVVVIRYIGSDAGTDKFWMFAYAKDEDRIIRGIHGESDMNPRDIV